MTTELLPCPFCGSKSVQTFTRTDKLFSWVYCGPCGAQGPVEAGRPDDSTPEERWNRRAALSRATQAEERVREALEHFEAIGALEVMEINPSNYDHELVCELSNNAVQAALIARAALAKLKAAPLQGGGT